MSRLTRMPIKSLARSRYGFSTAEVTMSALIVAILMVVALNAAGASARSQTDTADNARSILVAHGLLAEILEQPFEDQQTIPVFGRESGEKGGDRQDFDDVDDYHGWTKTPPEDKQGKVLANTTGLTTTVDVTLANPDDLRAGTTGGVAELKWVTVKVLRSSKVLATVQAAVSK